jgi:sulfate permease, SulP family
LSRANHASLEKGGFFGGKSRHLAFRDQNSALAWCEDQLLAGTDIHARMANGGFENWLQSQLGENVKSSDLIEYLERKDIVEQQLLYSRGDMADSVDLVAAGALIVEIPSADGTSAHTRRIMTHTVVGEMGFFRRSVRSANVLTDGAATIYTLTRDEFTRMQRERPDLSNAFYHFIICVLADRIEFSNREIAALSA